MTIYDQRRYPVYPNRWEEPVLKGSDKGAAKNHVHKSKAKKSAKSTGSAVTHETHKLGKSSSNTNNFLNILFGAFALYGISSLFNGGLFNTANTGIARATGSQAFYPTFSISQQPLVGTPDQVGSLLPTQLPNVPIPTNNPVFTPVKTLGDAKTNWFNTQTLFYS